MKPLLNLLERSRGDSPGARAPHQMYPETDLMVLRFMTHSPRARTRENLAHTRLFTSRA